jgi:DNA-directed RNA polymerase sigma subunit (sigma70/sigma32)
MNTNVERTKLVRPAGRRVRLMRVLHLEALLQQGEKCLTEMEVAALKYRLGLVDGRTHTLRDTAARHGCTPGRVKAAEEILLGKPLRSVSDAELQAIVRKMFDDPQWAEKWLAKCKED